MNLVQTLLLVQWVPMLHGFYISECIGPLGMESGDIPDQDISATSCHHGEVGPKYARLNKDKGGGAWCPNNITRMEVSDWLEINLHDVYVITSVAIQGRFGNGDGVEYTEMYKIQYWRPRLSKWIWYRSDHLKENLPGSINSYVISKTELTPPTWASKIRFAPISAHPRHVCLRVELYGCMWSDGIVSYAIPKGDSRSNVIHLTDRTYDGQRGEELKGGLGQLVDGIYGGNEIREAAKNSPWVGWRNDSTPNPYILFEFERVREFSYVHIFSNNKFKRDVEIFSKAIISFSIGGRHFQDEPIHFWNVPDKKSEYSRNVSIGLRHRIGRFVRIEFNYSARWILISEVGFDSVVTQGHHDPEYQNPLINENTKLPPKKLDPVPGPTEEDPVYVAIIVGVIALLAILLAAGVALIVHRQRHRKCFASPVIKTHNQTRDSNGRCETSILNNKRVLELPSEVKSDEYQEPYQEYDSHGDSVMLEMQEYKDSNLRHFDDYTEPNCEYAVPEPSLAPLVLRRRLPVLIPHRLIALPNRLELEAILEAMANDPGSLRARAGYKTIRLQRPRVPNFPPQRLRMISKLCQGTFSTIFIAEANDVPEYGGLITSEKRLMAVRFCFNHSHDREDFERDIGILSALSSPYLARILGMCPMPFAVIMEYLDHGDLCTFLRNAPPPSLNKQLLIAEQIAAGMKYLETLNFVHRDLATRNCLISSCYQVKISDFGSDSEEFITDYHGLIGNAPLPLRWAAWETVMRGKYSVKTDVWSFGVTMHEIFTLCRRPPYAHMVNSEVLDNLAYMAEDNGRFECLPRCSIPLDIYSVMQQCWFRSDEARLSFADLHNFLAKKLDMGTYSS